MFRFLYVFACAFSFTNTINAQLTFDNVEESTRFSVNTEYISFVNFQGRPVESVGWGASTGVELTTAFGLDLHYAVHYWSGFSNSIASQQTTGIGYKYDITDWLEASVGYDRWFLSSISDTTVSESNNYFSFHLVADADFLKPHLSAHYFKGAETAHGVDLGLSAFMEFPNWHGKGKIEFEPDVTVNWGTNNSYVNSIERDFGNKFVTLVTPRTVFGVLNTEITAPIKYSQPRFSITAAMHIAIPHKLSEEDYVGDTFGYYTFGFNYFLYVHRPKKTDSEADNFSSSR